MTIFPSRRDLTSSAQPERAHVVRDEVLRPLDDPGQVADAQLIRLGKRRRERQPRRISKCTHSIRQLLRSCFIEPRRSELLSAGQIETEKIAAVARHDYILTPIET